MFYCIHDVWIMADTSYCLEKPVNIYTHKDSCDDRLSI